MFIRSILKRGDSHTLACQDSIFHHENDEYLIAAVFDGCSEVEDSHFASNLLRKTFKNEVEKQMQLEYNRLQLYDTSGLENYKEIEVTAQETMASFFKKLDLIRIELNLTPNDFASTCIFLFYDKFLEQGVIYAFGDGYISINDEKIIIDHNNKPQYITLFWKNLVNGEGVLNRFLESYEQIWRFSKIQNVIISTDGIMSFYHKDLPKEYVQDFLLKNNEINGKEIISQKSFFEKKYNILLTSGWKHFDDLGIIRIYNNE